MSFTQLLEAGKNWEFLAVVGGYLFRTFFKQASASKDADKAAKDEAMALTPRGWEKSKRRIGDGDLIKQ